LWNINWKRVVGSIIRNGGLLTLWTLGSLGSFIYSFANTRLRRRSHENPKAAQIQGPMTKSRTKQSEDILQQMVSTILDKAQVKKDEGPASLPRILIVAEGPN